MRSFSLVTLTLAAASSLLTSAAPLSNVVGVKADVGVGAEVAVRDIGVDVAAEAGVAVVARDDAQLDSIPKILEDLTNDLTEVLIQINSLTAANTTNATVSPLLDQVVDIVDTAVTDVKKLVGSPLSTILASVDGTTQATVTDVAQLLANVLTVVVNALGAVMKLLGGDVSVISTALNAVGKILSDLVSAILPLVGGLLAELLPLIGSLVPTLTSLAFNTLAGVLTLVL